MLIPDFCLLTPALRHTSSFRSHRHPSKAPAERNLYPRDSSDSSNFRFSRSFALSRNQSLAFASALCFVPQLTNRHAPTNLLPQFAACRPIVFAALFAPCGGTMPVLQI
jgi:hypothetical protein